jgi:hypothetical protein
VMVKLQAHSLVPKDTVRHSSRGRDEVEEQGEGQNDCFVCLEPKSGAPTLLKPVRILWKVPGETRKYLGAFHHTYPSPY